MGLSRPGARRSRATGDGLPSFDRLRYRRGDGTVFLWAFDLIQLNRVDNNQYIDVEAVPQSQLTTPTPTSPFSSSRAIDISRANGCRRSPRYDRCHLADDATTNTTQPSLPLRARRGKWRDDDYDVLKKRRALASPRTIGACRERRSSNCESGVPFPPHRELFGTRLVKTARVVLVVTDFAVTTNF